MGRTGAAQPGPAGVGPWPLAGARVWLAAGAGAVLAAAVLPTLVGRYYTQMLALAGIYVLVALGLNLLVGYTGQTSLGHAAFFAVGAYTGALLATRLGIGFWAAFPAAVLLAGGTGSLVALPALRLEGPYLAMVTIAFGLIVHSTLVEWADLTGGTQGVLNIPRPSVAGVRLTLEQQLPLVVAVAALAAVLVRNLVRSPWGRALVAVRENPLAARAVGLDTGVVKTAAFGVSAALAGAGGHLFAALQGFISPEAFEFETSVFFLIGVIFGGQGTLLGPLVGAPVMTFLPEVLQGFVDYRLIVYGAVVVASLYVLPLGVVGTLAHLVRGRRGPAAAAGAREDPPAGGERAAGTAAAAPGDPDLGAWSGGVATAALPEDPPRAAATVSRAAAGHGADRPPPAAGMGGASSRIAGMGGEWPRGVRGAARPLVSLEGIRVSFGGVRALNGVDLAVAPGAIHALIGPNGAGKTVLLNVLCGYHRPSAGTVRLGGRPVTGLPAERIARLGVARTFQTTQLFGALSVLDNVMAGCSGRLGRRVVDSFLATPRLRREEAARRAAALALLDFVGYPGSPDTPARALAFGHQRLVEIARALALEPRLLAMDEPAAGLNPREVAQLVELIARIRARGIAILLVEHHMELVMGVSDRVTVLNHGETLAEGPPAAVRSDPRVVEAYLGGEGAG